ncbi:MAG: glycosyltransferase [bacterium]
MKPFVLKDYPLLTENKPLVSICCATYNHEDFIAKAIEGFLMQKVSFPVEILINDDCSTDKTAKIIREYEHTYPHLIKPKYQIENQYSKGLKPFTRFLYPRATGKYIAICEGDDFWTDPNKLQKQVDFLEENKRYSMCCTNFSTVDKDGTVMKTECWDKKNNHSEISHLKILEYYIPKTLTLMLRREALADQLPVSYEGIYNGDSLVCGLVSKFGPAAYLNFVSGSYRVSEKGVWSMKSKIERTEMKISTFLVLKNIFKTQEEQRAINSRLARMKLIQASFFLKKRKLSDAFNATVESLKYSRKPLYDFGLKLFKRGFPA